MNILANRFLKDGFIYSFPTIISRGLTFLLLPIYTRYLSPTEYGIFDLIILFTNLFQIIITAEITQGLARYTTRKKRKKLKQKLVSTAFWFSNLMYLIFIFIMIFCLYLNFFKLPLDFNLSNSAILILYFIFFGVFYFLQNQLKWELKSNEYAKVSMLSSITTGLFTIIFVVVFDLNLIGMIGGLTVGYFLGSIFAFYPLRNLFKFHFSMRRLKHLLNFSFPLALNGVAAWIIISIDRIFLGYFVSAETIGYYTLGLKLASIVPLLFLGFQTALNPLIYNQYENSDTPNQIASIFKVYITVGILLCSFLATISYEIVLIIGTQDYIYASKIIGFLSISLFFISLDVFACGFGIKKKTKTLFMITISIIPLKLILSFLLINNFQLIGAMISSLTISILIFLIKMKISQKLYFVPYAWKPIFVLIFISFIYLWTLFYFFNNTHVVFKLLFFACCLSIFYKLNLLSLNDFKKLLHHKKTI